MKKQKIILVILLAFFCAVPCFSQYGNATNGRQANANFEGNLVSNNMMRSRDVLQEVLNKGKDNEITIADVQGDPYADKIFSNANLMYKDSLNLGAFLMRFNAYSDEMEVNNNEGENTVINKADYISVILRNEKYVPLNYSENNENIKKGFFIEKIEGTHASLYLRKYKTIKQGQEAKTSFHKKKPPVFIDRESFYLKLGTDKPIEIKLKKNKVLKAFPDKNTELKTFVGEKNLNIETEVGLISLVEYYNSIK